MARYTSIRFLTIGPVNGPMILHCNPKHLSVEQKKIWQDPKKLTIDISAEKKIKLNPLKKICLNENSFFVRTSSSVLSLYFPTNKFPRYYLSRWWTQLPLRIIKNKKKMMRVLQSDRLTKIFSSLVIFKLGREIFVFFVLLF